MNGHPIDSNNNPSNRNDLPSNQGQETLKGSKEFYNLLDKMKEIHNKKAHDYASPSNPFSNFEESAKFAGCSVDTTFKVLIGNKLARINELQNSGKSALNESLADSFLDLSVYTVLWSAYQEYQINKRSKIVGQIKEEMNQALKIPYTQTQGSTDGWLGIKRETDPRFLELHRREAEIRTRLINLERRISNVGEHCSVFYDRISKLERKRNAAKKRTSRKKSRISKRR